MSLSLDNKENIIANILNEKNKIVSTLSYEDSNGEFDELELADKHYYQLIPNKSKERQTLFVAGESGAGKSHFIREYAKTYNKMYKDNPIYLISYLAADETLDAYKVIKRLNVFEDKEKLFLKECMDLDLNENFRDSFVIFDDIDSITAKFEKKTIYDFLFKLLRVGRHFNISVAYLGHELYASHELKHILNESMSITFFPKFLNFKKLKYLLAEYFGLNKTDIAKISNIRDRAVTYIKGSDKIILSTTKAFII